jgi:hypothetical protein
MDFNIMYFKHFQMFKYLVEWTFFTNFINSHYINVALYFVDAYTNKTHNYNSAVMSLPNEHYFNVPSF